MSFRGVVEYVGSGKYISGWIRIPKNRCKGVAEWMDIESIAFLGVFINGELISTSVKFNQRLDVCNSEFIGCGFKADISKVSNNITAENFSVRFFVDGVGYDLEVLDGVKAALFINNISEGDLKIAIRNISPEIISSFTDSFDLRSKRIGLVERKNKLCIISYANDAGAWFPYFYKYYSNLVGGDSIYIVTPRPENFSEYKLGAVIDFPNMEFDDVARAIFMSDLASGLLAYFEWTLVCDVDEIIAPSRELGVNLIEYLEGKSGVLLSLGVDVVQCMDDKPFDFEDDIYKQRNYGILNSALCKPNLSNIPVVYTPGFHFCNKKTKFLGGKSDLLTLHLKWADINTRKNIVDIVNSTKYKNKNTATYCLNSAIEDFHPMLRKSSLRCFELDSPKVKEFKDRVLSNLKYNPLHNFYAGDHFLVDFLVKF